jgi:flagellar hook-associated protein 2
MGRISSSVGLITGTQIDETVNQLIELSAIPRDRLVRRTEQLQQEQAAVTELTALAISVQLAARSFGSETAFNRTQVASSNADALSAVRDGTPEVGEYQVRTLQTASTASFRSKNFASASAAFGESGTLTVRGGGFVDRSVRLQDLNGGRGVAAGAIRITDRSGASAVIDLSEAVSVDDVLARINEQSEIQVRANTDGDAIRLTDRSGGNASNLRVTEVGGGSTALDLGLSGINTASGSAVGSDILRLSNETRLSELRDGRGIGLSSGEDLAFEFRDGTALNVDFGDFSRPAGLSTGATGSAVANAELTFSAVAEGAAADGIEVRFVDDPSVTAGNETVRLLDSPGGRALVFSIEEGATTAADVVAALEADGKLSSEFTAAASGTGEGLVSSQDRAVLSGGAAIDAVSDPTVGDLLRVLNELDPTKLRAELAPGGDRIQLVDLTSGAGNFSVSDIGSGKVASELGIAGSSGSGTLQGTRLLSGLTTVSLDALRGGRGLGTLTSLDITTADGASAAVDVSAASTLQDVINAINDSGLAVEASVGTDGGGLRVRDLSGGEATNFTISSSDDTAASLGLAASTVDVFIEGESLDAQFVARGTRLSELNRGEGVDQGSIRVVDSNDNADVLTLSDGPIETVGQFIDAFNTLDVAIEAQLNETGDGVRLVDTGSGATAFRLEDLAGGTAAADLGLAGKATREIRDDALVFTSNGRQADVFQMGSDETAAGLVERIRAEGRFVTAALVNDPSGGSSISLRSRRGGEAGRLTVQSSGIDLGMRQSAVGRDAVMSIGGEGEAGGTLVRSGDGVFRNAIDGVTLTAKEVTDQPVNISVTSDRSSLESSLDRFVTQYNTLVGKIDELTFYDVNTATAGALFGRSEVLNLEASATRLVNSRLPGLGSIRSGIDLGFKVDQQGKLSLDKTKFREQLEAAPEDVERFLTHEERGLVAKIETLIDRYAGEDGGVLLNRTTTLNSQIQSNNSRIGRMSDRLERQRERLLEQFVQMEESIAKLQSNQQYLSAIQPIAVE